MKKKICAVLAAVALVLAVSLPAMAAVPNQPTDLFYVNDYAGVLSEETINAIVSSGSALDIGGGPQLVLTTVDFTDGLSMEEYAYEMFNAWQLGDASRDDGVLILMAIGERDYWATVGNGLDQQFSGGAIVDLMDTYMLDDFDSQRYDEAARNTYGAFLTRLGGAWQQGGATTQGSGAGTASSGIVNERYVYDDTGLLTDGDIKYLQDLGAETQDRVGASMTVALVQTTGGQDIEDYAYDAFDALGLNGNETLFFMSVAEDDYCIIPGQYIVKDLGGDRKFDKEWGKIASNQAEPPFDRGEYGSAARNTASAYSNLLISKLGGGQYADPGAVYYSYGPDYGLLFFSILLFAMILTPVVVVPYRRRYYRRYYGVPFNPFSRRYVRRYGPGGYWGHYGGPIPGYYTGPIGGWGRRPPPPRGGSSMGGGSNRPVGGGAAPSTGNRTRSSSGGASGSSRTRSSGGSMFGSSGGFTGGGGSTRGGGGGRSSSSMGGSSRSSGGFGGGGRSSGGSFGGGSRGGGGASRGGGGGRRR